MKRFARLSDLAAHEGREFATSGLLNIAGAVSRRGLPIKTMHIAQILDSRK